MGGTCRTQGIYKRYVLVRNVKGRDHLKDPGADGRIILK
jgi:hypothetical protein